MARDLYYARIPRENAKEINWDEVMENSWDSARWNSKQTEVMVHWVGKTPVGIGKILGTLKQTPQPHSVENTYIRENPKGKDLWEVRPGPPPKK